MVSTKEKTIITHSTGFPSAPTPSCSSHLFQSEDVLVKVELNLFVSDVDTQLLERVLLEVLKTKDVQDPYVHHALGRTSKTQKAEHYPAVTTYNASRALMTHTTEYFTTHQAQKQSPL